MEVDIDKLTALRVLGRGAMGTVFLVADQETGARFALKVVEKHPVGPTRPDADRRARWEMSVLARLSHAFLPTLLGSFETPELLAWALPFCPGGDLNALRHRLPDRVFSPAALRFYLSEVVAALAHLHSLSLVYRDLKPENLLLRADGHLILSDFDLSRHLAPSPPPALPPSSPDPAPLPRRRHHRRNLTRILFFPSAAEAKPQHLKKAKSARVSPVSRRRASAGGERSHSFVGTEEYVAPEVLHDDVHEFTVQDYVAQALLDHFKCVPTFLLVDVLHKFYHGFCKHHLALSTFLCHHFNRPHLDFFLHSPLPVPLLQDLSHTPRLRGDPQIPPQLRPHRLPHLRLCLPLPLVRLTDARARVPVVPQLYRP